MERLRLAASAVSAIPPLAARLASKRPARPAGMKSSIGQSKGPQLAGPKLPLPTTQLQPCLAEPVARRGAEPTLYRPGQAARLPPPAGRFQPNLLGLAARSRAEPASLPPGRPSREAARLMARSQPGLRAQAI